MWQGGGFILCEDIMSFTTFVDFLPNFVLTFILCAITLINILIWFEKDSAENTVALYLLMRMYGSHENRRISQSV